MSFLSNIQHLLNGVDVDSLLSEIASLKYELISVKKKMSVYPTSLMAKDKEIELLKQHNQSLSDDLVREKNDLLIRDEKIGALNQAITELKENNNILCSAEQKYKEEYESTKKAYVSLKEEKIALSNRMNELENIGLHLESLQSELSKKDSELLKTRNDYNELKSEHDKQQELLNNANSIINKDKTEIKKLSDICEELREYKQSQSEQINVLNSQIENRKNENDTLRQQIKKLETEKEDISPYMYLIEEKKQQEAIELKTNEARKKLQDTIDSAGVFLSGINHDEIKSVVENAIKSSKDVSESEDCTLEKFNELIADIENAINTAAKMEKELLEEESKRKKQEELTKLKLSLEDLISVSKSFLLGVSQEDIVQNLQAIIDDSVNYIKEKELLHDILVKKYKFLQNALDEAKKEIESVKKTELHVVKRSILEILDKKEGDIIDSENFFKKSEHELIRWRRIFEESILAGEHRFVCTNCGQDVKISGRKYERGMVSFFSHLHDSDYCEFKTTTGLSKEQIEARKYGLVAESDRHKRLKGLIHDALDGYESCRKGVAGVVEEQRINSNIPYMNWRRPDVMAKYNDLNIVFELQLSTTFISVVVQRDIFYRLNDYFIIWVFNFDDNQKYVDLTNLMCKDIYYANKRNVFIFDTEAQQASEDREELVLKCNWLDTDNTWHYSPNKGNGDGILITIDELKFDEETSKPYYFDAETPYYELYPEVKESIQKEERTKQQMIDALQTRMLQESEEAIIKRDYAIKQMIVNNGHILPFKEGNKYGFKYNNTILVPAKYSSYSEFGENGMYKVTFKRHNGLIDKFGNELFACDYIDFHSLSNGLIVSENTSGFYISGIGRISDRSPHDVISIDWLTSNLGVITINSSRIDVFFIDDEYLFKWTGNGYSYYSILGEQKNTSSYSKYHFTDDYSALWLKDSNTGMWKLMYLDGTEKNEDEYSDCRFESTRTIAISNGKATVYTLQGEIERMTEYNNIESFKFKNYSIVLKDNKYGLIDEKYSEILAPNYDNIRHDNNLIYAERNDLWCILNECGSKLSELEYNDIYFFKRWNSLWENWITTRKGEFYGLHNDKGRLVLEAKFEEILECEGLLICKYNDKWGLYNKEGFILLENKYDNIEYLRNDVNFVAYLDGKQYIYNIVDSYLDEIPYDTVSKLSNDYLVVQSNGLCGLRSVQGNIRIPIRYNSIVQFTKKTNNQLDIHPSIFKCRIDEKACAYSIPQNKLVIEAEFDDIEWWNEDEYKVKKGLKWGLYKIGIGLFTDIKYTSISSFTSTQISVSISDGDSIRQGYISPDGKEICSNSIDLPEGYVTKEFFSRWALFKGHEMIIPYEHTDSIEIIKKDLFKVKSNGKYGIKNSNNQYVFQPQYRDIISKNEENYVILKLIKYRREREYTYGRSYHMIDVEYNEYQLYNIDGTQSGIPSTYRGSYSEMSFGHTGYIWIDKHILSLEKFVISDDTYSSFEFFDEDGLLLVKKDKSGLLNSNLELILPCRFDTIKKWGNDLLLTIKNIRNWYNYTDITEYSLYKYDGIESSVGSFSYFEDMGDGTAKIMKNSAKALINTNGDIIPDSTEIINNEFTVSKALGCIEVKDIDGKVLIPLKANVTEISHLTSTYYVITQNYKQGVFNTKEPNAIKCEYNTIEPWSEGIILVSTYDIYNYKIFILLSLDGDKINDKSYNTISSIENGYAEAKRNGVLGRLNAQGLEVYDSEEPLTNNLVKRRCFGKWNVIDKKGHQILPYQYDDITMFTDSCILTSITKRESTSSYYSSSIQTTLYMLFTLDGNQLISNEFKNIKKCSNGTFIVTKGWYDALYSNDFDALIPFEKHCYSIREWTKELYVAHIDGSAAVINNKGDVLSKNKYSEIGDLQNGKAEVVLNKMKGFINENCEEISDITETKGQWTISRFFDKFTILKNNQTILSELYDATFLNDTLIKIKKISNYSIFSIVSESELPTQYLHIEKFNGPLAIAQNLNYLTGSIDEDGNEYYDKIIELSDTIIAKKKFSRYEVYKDGEIILKDLLDVSLWNSDKLKATIERNKVQIFSIKENKYLGDWYNSISELKDGKALVRKKQEVCYIDSNANEIPTEDICIGNNMHKILKFGLWYIVDDKNNKIINDSFREIGSYRGRFVEFDGRSFRMLEYKTSKIVPVYGTYYKENISTLTYIVDRRYVKVHKNELDLSGKSLSEFINENKKIQLAISYINFKKQIVYAKPYNEIANKNDFPPFEIGQVVKGEIIKVSPFGIRIKCEDGRNTLIHVSRLQELGYGDSKFEQSQALTIKKIGFDEEHHKDIWEIISNSD